MRGMLKNALICLPLFLLATAACSDVDDSGESAGALTDGEEEPTESGSKSAGAANVDVKAVLAKLANCNQISSGTYEHKKGSGESVPICGIGDNVAYFTADLDVDCDGKSTDVCSSSTDPDFQSDTSGHDSKGGALDAANLPFIVVPLASDRFDYKQNGIGMGTVALVIYNGRAAFGVVGDLGPKTIIGEASVAMAKALGIPASPRAGGAESGVTYVLFTGSSGKVKALENQEETARIGQQRVAELIGSSASTPAPAGTGSSVPPGVTPAPTPYP